MSSIVCLKENDTLLLGTDSRFMNLDFSGVASDAESKIFEVAPGTFLATSGRLRACRFQAYKAGELAKKMGTADIRIISDALIAESVTCLRALLEDLRPVQNVEPGIALAVSGAALLHGCVLVGRTADGQLGLIAHRYWVSGGVVVCDPEEYYGPTRKIIATSGAPPDRLLASFGFVQDPAIWTDPPESVVRRILRDMKATGLSGGPDQLVCLGPDGARWISPPPVPQSPLVGNLLSATISATVSMISPVISGGSIAGSSLVITNGTITIQINATNRIKITNSANGFSLTADEAGIATSLGGITTHISGIAVTVQDSSGNISTQNVAGFSVQNAAGHGYSYGTGGPVAF